MEKPGLSQMIKVNTNSDKWYWQYDGIDSDNRQHFISIVFLPRTHNFSLTMRKTSDKPTLRNILQNNWPVTKVTSSLSRSLKTRKAGETAGVQKILRRHDDQMGGIHVRWVAGQAFLAGGTQLAAASAARWVKTTPPRQGIWWSSCGLAWAITSSLFLAGPFPTARAPRLPCHFFCSFLGKLGKRGVLMMWGCSDVF